MKDHRRPYDVHPSRQLHRAAFGLSFNRTAGGLNEAEDSVLITGTVVLFCWSPVGLYLSGISN